MTARGAVAEQLARLEHQHVVGVTQGNIDVVHHHRSRCCAAGLPAHQIHHVKLVVEVKGAERFVEQQQARLADQRWARPTSCFCPPES